LTLAFFKCLCYQGCGSPGRFPSRNPVQLVFGTSPLALHFPSFLIIFFLAPLVSGRSPAIPLRFPPPVENFPWWTPSSHLYHLFGTLVPLARGPVVCTYSAHPPLFPNRSVLRSASYIIPRLTPRIFPTSSLRGSIKPFVDAFDRLLYLSFHLDKLCP